MTDIQSLITVGLAFFIAAASPGPATLAVATVSMSSGRWSGIKFGLGLSLGLAVWGAVAATGLGAVIEASGAALIVLKLLGGGYLVWLAYKSARSASSKAPTKQNIDVGSKVFQRGLLLNLLNPKAVFAWMAVLALGLGDSSSATHIMAATGVCMALGVAIYISYALLFSTSHAMSAYQRTRRWIEALVAGVFAVAGFSLIRSALIRE